MRILLLMIYLLIVNVATFAMFGIDKQAARQNKRRIPEMRLFIWSAAGGSLGSWLGMRLFRHKTKHISFTIGIPVLLILDIAAGSWLVRELLR